MISIPSEVTLSEFEMFTIQSVNDFLIYAIGHGRTKH